MPVQDLIAGRTLEDPKGAQAFDEISDRLDTIFATITISPENQVGYGGFPNESLGFDFNHPTKRLGIGLPQLTATDRNSLRNPPVGTIVYNTSLNCLSLWNGVEWRDIGAIVSTYGQVGNSGAAETMLLQVPLPKSFLENDGQLLEYQFLAVTAGNANLKKLRGYLGNQAFGSATLIFDTNFQAANNLSYRVNGNILRRGAASQYTDTIIWLQGFPVEFRSTASTLTMADEQYLTITGTGTANNDVVGYSLLVRKN